MIYLKDNCFILNTRHTSYVMKLNSARIMEHLYYGDLISLDQLDSLQQDYGDPGNAVLLGRDNEAYYLEGLNQEISSEGKGDIRDPFIALTHPDGSVSSDFRFESYRIGKGKLPLETLPSSYDENQKADHLYLLLEDRNDDLTLRLDYYVFEEEDVISRTAKLINHSDKSIWLERMMSAQLDATGKGYRITTFNGSWAKEMNRHDTIVSAGRYENGVYAGVSSSRANPFTMMAKADCQEDSGEVYGFNLIYSGNHLTSYEVNSLGNTRVLVGINPRHFRFEIKPSECFEAPEALLSYSHQGYNGLSDQFHRFIRSHILPIRWRNADRPILLNSWEACYFDIDQDKLLELADQASQAGVELLVMDDGWFGKRNDDTSSLGDWQVNTAKLPQGLKGLAEKVNQRGLQFGLWLEPEMVNRDSNLYRNHPDWVMQIPGKAHAEGRHQRILDLANPKVQQYIIRFVDLILSEAPISYIKWDMNRIVSDVYSTTLPANRQTEVLHRYQMGLYHVMREVTSRHPDVLFEGCASGGNRFDLGILCYFPQIWASDNTDAYDRARLQRSLSYGYPQCSYTGHVSAVPNHQTGRTTRLADRFAIGALTVFGYELELGKLTEQEREAVRRQIVLYKTHRRLLQYGRLVRTDQGMTVTLDGQQAQILSDPQADFDRWQADIHFE